MGRACPTLPVRGDGWSRAQPELRRIVFCPFIERDLRDLAL